MKNATSSGIPTAALSRYGTLCTPPGGKTATAVRPSRATLRPTPPLPIAADRPTSVRARVPATARRAFLLQLRPRLLQFPVSRPCLLQRRCGTPTTTPAGKPGSASTPSPCHHTAVDHCTQRSSNAASSRTRDRVTTTALRTWPTHLLPCPLRLSPRQALRCRPRQSRRMNQRLLVLPKLPRRFLQL